MNEVIKKVRPKCRHNKYLIDETKNSVECGVCGEDLNAIWVLGQLAIDEHRAVMHLEHLDKMAAKADAKNRCKCEHCSKMTRIHRH